MNTLNIKYPMLIDGGLSNELEDAGFNLDHKLWTAKLLAGNPNAIRNAHLSYLNAGAKCITTSGYQATIPGFMESGYERAQAEDLILKTVRIASEAIDIFLNSNDVDYQPLIAASVGPYGAYLADGSEYRGGYDISDDELMKFHSSRIALLDKSKADILACETIPSYREAAILSEILMNSCKPAWIAFSCKNENQVNDGTNISDCINLFMDNPNVFAIGVNCSAPKYISGIIKNLKAKSSSKRIIVYPNSGRKYDEINKIWRGVSDPAPFTAMALEWLASGADIIGGCCGIGPKHIRELNERIIKNKLGII